jgi:hypothetical protein
MKDVSITIIGADGNEIKKLENCSNNAGENILRWKPVNLVNGIYFYKFSYSTQSGLKYNYSGKIVKE